MRSKCAFTVRYLVLVAAVLGGCAASVAEKEEVVVAPDFGALTDSMKFAGEVPFDGYHTSRLGTDGEFELFSFEARGGSDVTVELVDGETSRTLTPNLFLVGPVDDGAFPELGRAVALESDFNVSATIPEDGEYLIAVGAQRGHGTYTLALWCDSAVCSMPR